MSTNKRPVAVRAAKQTINARKGILYYTIGTQQIDAEGNFFIDDTIVKEGFNSSIVNTLANAGTIIVLEDGVLEDYEANGFSYIDSNNASTNTIKKLKEAEAAIKDLESRNLKLEAKMTTKPTKAKGGDNA